MSKTSIIKYTFMSEIPLLIEYKIELDELEVIEDTYPNVKRYASIEDNDEGKSRYIKYVITNAYHKPLNNVKIQEPSLLYKGYLEYKIVLDGDVINPCKSVMELESIEPDYELNLEIILKDKNNHKS